MARNVIPASSTARPAINPPRELVRASVRENTVTPTTYTPTPAASIHAAILPHSTDGLAASAASGATLIPNSTFNPRHAPMTSGATTVLLRTRSYNTTHAARSVAMTPGRRSRVVTLTNQPTSTP